MTDSSFSADWNITSSSGAVQYTYRLVGGCSAPAAFGFRPCVLVTVQCREASASCTGVPVAGDIFYLLEIPGVSFLVYVPTRNIAMSGVVRGDCSSPVAGDYTTMPTGGLQANYFGMYRSDASFTNLIGSGFALIDPASPQLYYSTTDSGGTGAATLGGVTCNDGIRDFTLDGIPVRATTTAGGLWSFAFPSGLGGAISFKTSLAAVTSDLANKTLNGFTAAVNGPAEMVSLETGALAGTHVPYTKLVVSDFGEIPTNGQYFISAKDAGALYGLNGDPAGAGGTSYATNLLQPAYPTPGDVPGLFVAPVGATAANGSFVTAMKSNGKLIVFGIAFGNVSGSMRPVSTTILFEQ